MQIARITMRPIEETLSASRPLVESTWAESGPPVDEDALGQLLGAHMSSARHRDHEGVSANAHEEQAPVILVSLDVDHR